MSDFHAVILADFATPNGGAPKVAIDSARALAEAGLGVTYIHAVAGQPDAKLLHPGIAVRDLGLPDVWDRPLPQAAAAGVWSREAARRLAALLGGLAPGPMVLHLHQWTRGFSPAVLPVLLASGRPLALTVHDYFLACPNGVYYRFDKGEPCSLAPLSAACIIASCDPRSPAHKLIRVLRSAATRIALRGSALDLVHVSDRGRDTIAPFLPAGMRHHRIDNPVEAVRRPPPALGPSVAYVGRLTSEKGADLVALAARRAGMPALFVGEGPLASTIAHLHPEARILPWMAPDLLAGLLAQEARLLAAPSRWFETGPLTVYEAMAAGLPAVVSLRAGAAEKVANGVTGFVVEPFEEPLAAAFSRFKDAALARRLGDAAAAAYWRSPPTPAAHAARLCALYERMLGARRGTSAAA